jgi:nucleotide-binding universal stress UspA family protein
MYDRLLVAVDRSETSRRVVNAAREIAALSDGGLWVLHGPGYAAHLRRGA